MNIIKECSGVTSDQLFQIMLLERIEKLEDNIATIPELNITKVRELKEEISILKIDMNFVTDKLTRISDRLYNLEEEIFILRKDDQHLPKTVKLCLLSLAMIASMMLGIEIVKLFKN